MALPYKKSANDQPRQRPTILPNPPTGTTNMAGVAKEKRNRDSRKLPNFMYGATFPRDAVGSGGPTYGGALEWMYKHQEYFNQALTFLQRYPNMIEERCLDNFWDFLEPLIYNNNLLIKYDDFLNTQFGFKETFVLGKHFDQPLPTPAQFFKSDGDSRKSEFNYPVRRIFFCYDRSCQHQQHIKHLIVDALEPFVSVRTNPTTNQASHAKSLDICRSICGSVFIMLINDAVLNDSVCIHLLSIAIAYKSPIIFIRESGYRMPDNIRDVKIPYVRMPSDVPFEPKNTKITEHIKRKPTASTPTSKHASIDDSREDTENCLSVKQIRDAKLAVEAELSGSVLQTIQESYSNSLVFSHKMFDTSISSIYEKIAPYIGVRFPGTVPSFPGETDAPELSRPVTGSGMFSPSKKIYRIGSARVTKLYQEPQVSNNNSNNDSHSCPIEPMIVPREHNSRPRSASRSIYVPFQYNRDKAIQRPKTAGHKSTAAILLRNTNDLLQSTLSGQRSPFHSSNEDNGSW